MATTKSTADSANHSQTGSTKTPPKTPAAGSGQPIFTPTPQAKQKARNFRIIALALWIVAIGLEALSIFRVLRPPFDQLAAAHGFPTWRWWLLIGLIVVIGVMSIVGSQFWKRANRSDPASSSQPVRFFVQNQLGAIIALIAFVPLVIMVFLNKDMNSKQRGVAGGIGVVVALAAILLGIDFTPLSQEQAAVESQVVTQLTGQDEVWWSAGGGVMHLCQGVSALQNVTTEVSHGTTAEAFAAGKTGITLQLQTELNQCGYPTPDNLPDIVAWVRQARGLDAGSATPSASPEPSATET